MFVLTILRNNLHRLWLTDTAKPSAGRGGGQRRGRWFENPYTGSAGWMQILQVPSDPEQVWFSHQIDVRADFKDRFGYPPPNPSYIAIAAHSDDIKSMFSAQVRTLGFSG